MDTPRALARCGSAHGGSACGVRLIDGGARGDEQRRQERERMECKGAGVDRHLSTQCSPAWMAAANPVTQQLCCWSTNHVGRGSAHPRCPQTVATLECAKANLKRFAFVGVVERMNQSVALMKHALGMRFGGTVSRGGRG